MVDLNILRFDGPVDHYVLRPFGIMRCPPAPPAPPARPQVDVDDFLHQHEPAFDNYITWQKESIALSQAAITTARRARDAAEFKQWVAMGTLLPAVGFLATSYAMMFTFPFIVPGAILFAVTSVGIALLVGFEERARSDYMEAHTAWQRASWVLESQKTSLDVAEKTFARLQTQFGDHIDVPRVATPQPAAPTALPARRTALPARHAPPERAATTATAPSSTSSSMPSAAPSWSTFVPPPEVFGWHHYDNASSSSGASSPSRASHVSLGADVSAAAVATAGDAQPVPSPATTHDASAVDAPVVAPDIVEGWAQD